MKTESKTRKKNRLSPEKQALAAEWIANLPAWAEKAATLVAQLRPSPTEEREAFFTRLLAGAGDRALPLLHALRGNDEGLDLALARGFAHVGLSLGGRIFGELGRKESFQKYRKRNPKIALSLEKQRNAGAGV